MKKILKLTLLLSFSLALSNQIWGNLVFSENVLTIVKVSFILTVFELLLKPILKILLLPINILTLGLFRVVINTVGFYLATFLLVDFIVNNINTSSTVWQGFTIPAFNFTGFWAYVVSTTTVNLILYFFKFILKPKKDKK